MFNKRPTRIKATHRPIDYDEEPKIRQKLSAILNGLATTAKQMALYTHADAHSGNAIDRFIEQAKREIAALVKEIHGIHTLLIQRVAAKGAAEAKRIQSRIDLIVSKIAEYDEKIEKIREKHPETAMQNSEGLLTGFTFRKVLVFVFIMTDYSTLFTLFDTILMQDLFLALIFTFSATLCYNYLPIVIAHEINKIKEDKNHSRTLLYVYSGVFAVIAIVTFALRLSTRETIFVDPFDGIVDHSALMSQMTVSPDSPAAYIATISMGLIPVGTSLISLWLALKDDPYTVEMHNLISKKKRLEKKLIKLYSKLEEIGRDIEGELMAFEQEAYESFLERAFAEIDQQKNQYIKLLCVKNKEPDPISILTEPPSEDPDAAGEMPSVLHKASHGK